MQWWNTISMVVVWIQIIKEESYKIFAHFPVNFDFETCEWSISHTIDTILKPTLLNGYSNQGWKKTYLAKFLMSLSVTVNLSVVIIYHIEETLLIQEDGRGG